MKNRITAALAAAALTVLSFTIAPVAAEDDGLTREDRIIETLRYKVAMKKWRIHYLRETRPRVREVARALPPCETRRSEDCVWRAPNGGQKFVDLGGKHYEFGL